MRVGIYAGRDEQVIMCESESAGYQSSCADWKLQVVIYELESVGRHVRVIPPKKYCFQK